MQIAMYYEVFQHFSYNTTDMHGQLTLMPYSRSRTVFIS